MAPRDGVQQRRALLASHTTAVIGFLFVGSFFLREEHPVWAAVCGLCAIVNVVAVLFERRSWRRQDSQL